jgi:hydrogenase/urease accessory protein HupE
VEGLAAANGPDSLFPNHGPRALAIKGAGDFVNGLLHPLITPTHLLIIVGIGLMAGRPTARDLLAPLWIFAPLSALTLG